VVHATCPLVTVTWDIMGEAEKKGQRADQGERIEAVLLS